MANAVTLGQTIWTSVGSQKIWG